jgi:hypothetical protein
VISFLFVHFADIEPVLGLAGLDGSDNDSSVPPPVVNDTLDFSSQFDRVIRASRSFL